MRRHNVRLIKPDIAGRAVWLLVLGALATSGIRSGTQQISPVPAQATPSDEVTLRVIVVDSAEEAQSLVSRLRGGEDFIALAHAESIDPTANTGGLLGKLTLSTLPPVLKDALVGVGPGQLSPIVRIPTGFAILKVVDETDPAHINMNAATPASLATRADVKYVIDVSGLVEAEAILQAFPKPKDWNQSPASICQVRRQSSGIVRAIARGFPVAGETRRPRHATTLRRHAGPLRPGSTPCLLRPHGSRARSVSTGLRDCSRCCPRCRTADGGSVGRRVPAQGRNGERRPSRAR